MPVDNGRVGTIAFGHFAGVGLDLSTGLDTKRLNRTPAAAALPSVIGGLDKASSSAPACASRGWRIARLHWR
jgi:hypothetical protein